MQGHSGLHPLYGALWCRFFSSGGGTPGVQPGTLSALLHRWRYICSVGMEEFLVSVPEWG